MNLTKRQKQKEKRKNRQREQKDGNFKHNPTNYHIKCKQSTHTN